MWKYPATSQSLPHKNVMTKVISLFYLFIYLFLEWVMSLFVVVELENDYVPSITPRDAIPCAMLNGMEVRTPPPTTM